MDDDTKPSDKQDAFLPLPDEPNSEPQPAASKPEDPAVGLARQKVSHAFGHEPSAAAEALDLEEMGKALHQSKHQKFIFDLTNSGKSLEEIQTEWHEYYAGLPDNQKHEVWQEFYSTHSQATKLAASMPQVIVKHPKGVEIEAEEISKEAYKPPKRLSKRLLKEHSSKEMPIEPEPVRRRPLKSLLVGLSAGVITIFILLFSFFNERFIAPLIQPSRNASNIQLIDSNGAVSDASEVIIPKINVEIPVVYDVNTIDENTVLAGLERGVVHYADTALPGQKGNAVYVGHSSNNILNKGKYKFAFVLLHKLEIGDTFYLQKNGKRYTYQVTNRTIVKPTDVSVLASSTSPTASLITCDPPGTSNNRLVVTGTQIDPDPSTDAPSTATNSLATQTKIIPGNSPTLWSRLAHWLTE